MAKEVPFLAPMVKAPVDCFGWGNWGCFEGLVRDVIEVGEVGDDEVDSAFSWEFGIELSLDFVLLGVTLVTKVAIAVVVVVVVVVGVGVGVGVGVLEASEGVWTEGESSLFEGELEEEGEWRELMGLLGKE